MNFQVCDLLHQEYHLLEGDIFIILAIKDVELQPFILPVILEQKGNEKIKLLLYFVICLSLWIHMQI